MNEVGVTAVSVCAVLTPLIAWLWQHSSRLTAAEVRIAGLQLSFDTHSREVSAQLYNINAKLDRMIEREIARP